MEIAVAVAVAEGAGPSWVESFWVGAAQMNNSLKIEIKIEKNECENKKTGR